MEFASEFEQDSDWSLMAGANNFFNGPLTCLDVEELKFPPYDRTLCAAAAHPKAEPKISVESKAAAPVYCEVDARFLHQSPEEPEELAELYPGLFSDLWPDEPLPDVEPEVNSEPVPTQVTQVTQVTQITQVTIPHICCSFETPTNSEEEIDVVSIDSPPLLPAAPASDGTPPRTPPDRRSHHNILERQRRSDLRDEFEKVRRLIPQLSKTSKASKQVILTTAVVVIRKLRQREKTLLNELEIQQKINQKMVNRVKQLCEQRPL